VIALLLLLSQTPCQLSITNYSPAYYLLPPFPLYLMSHHLHFLQNAFACKNCLESSFLNRKIFGSSEPPQLLCTKHEIEYVLNSVALNAQQLVFTYEPI